MAHHDAVYKSFEDLLVEIHENIKVGVVFLNRPAAANA
jgi:hypothetical protein